MQPRVGITVPFSPLCITAFSLMHRMEASEEFLFQKQQRKLLSWGHIDDYKGMPSSTASMLGPRNCQCGSGTITWDLLEMKNLGPHRKH